MEPVNPAALNQLYLQAVSQLRRVKALMQQIEAGIQQLPAAQPDDQELIAVIDRFLVPPHRSVFLAIGGVGTVSVPDLWRYPEVRDALVQCLGEEADQGHLERIIAELRDWGLVATRRVIPEPGVEITAVSFTPVGVRLCRAITGKAPRQVIRHAPGEQKESAPPASVPEPQRQGVAAEAREATQMGTPGTAGQSAPGTLRARQPEARRSQPNVPGRAERQSATARSGGEQPTPPAGPGKTEERIPELTEEQKLALKAVGLSGYSRVAELVRFPAVIESFMQGGTVRDDLFANRINELKRMGLIAARARVSTGVRGHSYAPIELTELGKRAFRHYFHKEPAPSEIPALENRFKSLAFAYFVRDVYRAFKERGWNASMDQEDTLLTLPVKPEPGKPPYTIRMSVISRNGDKTFYHKCFMTIPEDKVFFRFLNRYRLLTREFYMICPNQALVDQLIASFERWTQQTRPELLRNLEANFTTLEGLKKEKPWFRISFDENGTRL